MTDEQQGLEEAELEGESGEVLPEREAMSVITPPGESSDFVEIWDTPPPHEPGDPQF
ncbi:MAG: hypothetical protein ACRDN6_05505 [Gaiellaceae bacterium]